MGVPVCNNCDEWELHCVEVKSVAVWGSCGVGESRNVAVVMGGVSLWGRHIMWWLRWLLSLNSLHFRHHSRFPQNPQKTNYLKNLPQLTLQKPIGKIFFKRIFSYQNKSQPRSVPNSDQLSHVLLTC